jgi:hypothetical protein
MKNLVQKPFSFIVLSFLILIFLLEIFFRFFNQERIVPDLHQSQYNLPNVLRSNLDVTLDWSHGYLYPPFRLQTNSKRFLNDQEFQYKKPSDTFRILMLGNSIFMGLGVENAELFSKNLQDILNKRSTQKRVEVINFSGVAWSAIEFLKFLKSEGYKYQPDLVIVSQGENDFRVQYNNLIQLNKIGKEKQDDGRLKISLGDLEINPQGDSQISSKWEWVRKLPYYVEISKHSQVLYRIRSKLNALWHKKTPIVSNPNQLGYFLENNDIEITKDTILSLDEDQFAVQPEGHSIAYFAKNDNRGLYDANANIILHSALQGSISQFLSSINGNFMAVDIPARLEVLSLIKPNQTRRLNSKLKNYYYLNPTETFKKFQVNNIETPLYFYGNNHLSPAGHRLLALLTYNFLAINRLLPSQSSWELMDPFSPEINKSVVKANNRIEKFVNSDSRSDKFRGLLYLVNGKYKLARETLSQYLQNENNDFEAHYFLGNVLFHLLEFSSALDSYERSFGGHPLELKKYKYAYNFTKLYKEGWGTYKTGDLQKALFFAKKLEELKGEWQPKVNFLNYLIYQKMGDLKAAEFYMKQLN